MVCSGSEVSGVLDSSTGHCLGVSFFSKESHEEGLSLRLDMSLNLFKYSMCMGLRY